MEKIWKEILCPANIDPFLGTVDEKKKKKKKKDNDGVF